MLIIFDWDGTIARKEISEEAGCLRLSMLGIKKSAAWMAKAQKTHAHYDVTKQALSRLTGYTHDRDLTVMMTNLFQICYLAMVNKHKEDIFYERLHYILEDLKTQYGLKYAIVSTLREDIIKPAVELLGVAHLFEYVLGNTADLQYSKTDLVKKLKKENPYLVVGDRKDDLLAGKEIGIKTAYAIWGHGMDEDSHLADFILQKPMDLRNVIEHMLKE